MENGRVLCPCLCQNHTDTVKQHDQKSGAVIQVWRDFLSQTTFHGCRNIEDKRRSILYRVLWSLMVLGMLGGLLFTLAQSYMEYYKYNITTKSRIQVRRDMSFPAITICSVAAINSARKNMSETIENYFARTTPLGYLIPPVDEDGNESDLEEWTIKDVIDEFTIWDQERIIVNQVWTGFGNITFKAINTDLGKCLTANNATDYRQRAKATAEGRTGGLELVINLEEDGVIFQGDMAHGAIVFLHDPREYARTLDSGVMVAPGHSFYINLKPTKYKFLPAPYRSYGNSYCVDTNNSYSYEACLNAWIAIKTSTYCNCTTGMEALAVLELLSVCSLNKYSSCYKVTHAKFRKQTLEDTFTACPRPCSFTSYETSVSFSKFPSPAAADRIVSLFRVYGYPHADRDFVSRNILKVTIYFDKFLMESVEYVPEVTINSILSSLGGQMGFFLGASLMTVVELGETLLNLVWAVGRKIVSNGNNRVKTIATSTS